MIILESETSLIAIFGLLKKSVRTNFSRILKKILYRGFLKARRTARKAGMMISTIERIMAGFGLLSSFQR